MRLTTTITALALILTGCATTAPDGTTSTNTRPVVDAGYLRFVSTFSANLSPTEQRLFNAAHGPSQAPNARVLTLLEQQPEFTTTFADYRGKRLSPARLSRGQTLLAEEGAALTNISAATNIPAAVIVALWGLESNYGQNMGNMNVIHALSTLAYKSHRQAFYRQELNAAVKILAGGHVAPEAFTGSWAGALGQCQFMPSNFIKLAQDGDGDGKKDIWGNRADVFASIAHYLQTHGWRPGQPWGEPATVPADLSGLKRSTRGLTERLPLSDFTKAGVTPQSGSWPAGVTQARLFYPEEPNATPLIVYDNFDVIMRWNRSAFFAATVLQLADHFTPTPTPSQE